LQKAEPSAFHHPAMTDPVGHQLCPPLSVQQNWVYPSQHVLLQSQLPLPHAQMKA
jgi:hypothetical protein